MVSDTSMSQQLNDKAGQSALDIERNELLRLMDTAKSDDRKAIIRDNLVNLESPVDKKLSSNKKNATAAIMASRFNNIFETEKVASETVFLKSPPVRPMSARLRRPSMNNLDSIQEERKLPLSTENVSVVKDKSVVALRQDDVCAISASSQDPRIGRWNPFTSNPTSRWISTGLLPQFLAIDLQLSWFIVEVKINCFGVKAASFSIEGCSPSKIPLKMENSTTFSSSMMTNIGGSRSSKMCGNRVIITLEESSDTFVVISSIFIQAVPTG